MEIRPPPKACYRPRLGVWAPSPRHCACASGSFEGRSRDLSFQGGKPPLTGGKPRLYDSPVRQTRLSRNTIHSGAQAVFTSPFELQ